MENNVEKKHLDINEYINIIQRELVKCKSSDEVIEIKNKVIPKYVELYNSQKVNTKDLAKFSGLIESIEEKEKEMEKALMDKKDEELIKIANKNMELIKETKELLDNINNMNKMLNKKEE